VRGPGAGPATSPSEGYWRTHYIGLDVSQKFTSICIVDATGRKLWRGQCASDPEQIERTIGRHRGEDVRVGIETSPVTPWLVHELRGRGLDVTCLDAAKAALKLQINKTDQNDAEGPAQIMRTGWYRAVHVKSLDAHRARALLGARAQLVGMTTRLSNHIRGVLKTFGMLPGAKRGQRFYRRIESLLAERADVALIVRPMLVAWRRLREQIAGPSLTIRRRASHAPGAASACRVAPPTSARRSAAWSRPRWPISSRGRKRST
jgi:transposase